MRYEIRLHEDPYDWNSFDDTTTDPVEISQDVFELLQKMDDGWGQKRRDVWHYIDEYTPIQIRRIK